MAADVSNMIKVVAVKDGYFRVTKTVKGDRWTRLVAPTDMMTVAEVAAALHVSTMTVGRWIADGEIKSATWRYGGQRIVARTVRQYAEINGLFLGAGNDRKR